MTVGSINADGDALACVHVAAPDTGAEHTVEAILDTGFNGFLALQRRQVEEIGLEPTGEVPFETASGETFVSRTYEATVVFGGQERDIEVVEAAEPLVGTALLWGFEVRLAYHEEGQVTLEVL